MKTKSKSDILKIGWYQIIGGGIGELFILYSLFSPTQVSGFEVLVYISMLLFFGYSIFCGILCLKHTNNALTHSLINQILQLLGFAFGGFAFSYVAGIYVSVGFDFSSSIEMKFDFGLSEFDFNLNRQYERAEIYFNLVAFGLIYWIDRVSTKIKAEKVNMEITSIEQD